MLSPAEQQFLGYTQGDKTGSQIADFTSGATVAGLGITAATGGMDLGLATAIGAGVEFLSPIIGGFFDDPPAPMYADAPAGPMLQLPTSGTQLFVPEGVNVMGGPSLAEQYGVQDPMGFFV